MKMVFGFLVLLASIPSASLASQDRCPAWTTDALFNTGVYRVCFMPNFDRFMMNMNQQSRSAEPYTSRDVNERLSTLLTFWRDTDQKFRILETFQSREAFRKLLEPVFNKLANQRSLSSAHLDKELRLARLQWNDTETKIAKDLVFLLAHEQWSQDQLGPAFGRRAEMEAFLLSGSETNRRDLVDHYKLIRRRLGIFMSEVAMKPERLNRATPLFLFTINRAPEKPASSRVENKEAIQSLGENRHLLISKTYRDPSCENRRKDVLGQITETMRSLQYTSATDVPVHFVEMVEKLRWAKSISASWLKSTTRLESLLDVLNARASVNLDRLTNLYSERSDQLPSNLRQEGANLMRLISLAQSLGELKDDVQQFFEFLPQQPILGFSESLRRVVIEVINRNDSERAVAELESALDRLLAQSEFDLARVQKLKKSETSSTEVEDLQNVARELDDAVHQLFVRCQ